MSDAGELVINIDGASRGNPGPAAFGCVIQQNGTIVEEVAGFLGQTTNNVAEYTALIRALEKAAERGAKRLIIYSDSELLVKQMNGEYQVKNPALREHYVQARHLFDRFDAVSIRHVRREQNSEADRLCNETLDAQARRMRKTTASAKKPAAARKLPDSVRADIIDCLRSAAQTWAKGNAQVPTPEAVWEQLWSILEENGVLRPAPSR